MPSHVVLVGPHDFFFDPVAAALRAQGDTSTRYSSIDAFARRADALDGADVLYAVGYLPVTRERLAHTGKLRAVISPWTGTDGFDEAAATDLGIIVGNGQVPENAESMAEATIMMVLSCLYDFNESQRRLRANLPNPADLTARMLKGKTLGFIGYGGIAKEMTARLSGWGVRLQAHTPRPPQAYPGVSFVGLDEVLATSDVICVLAPLNAGTRNLLNAQRLAATKSGAILVVTSRGGIVDEAALHDLTQRGHFSAVALDVFETEPLPADSPLRGLDKAVLTPHCVGLTRESRVRLIETGVTNVLRVLAGEAPLYVRNPAILDAWRRRWSRQA